jgi:glyoxylase-like metal-dependent hydrolase (beta-lactamase superfamily II)
MKITDVVHLVASGRNGAWITNAHDCHVYLLNGGDELALIDAGCGLAVEATLENIRNAGLDPQKVAFILITHGHADHSGAAAELKARTHARVAIGKPEAEFLRTANEDELGLTIARREGFYPADYKLKACAVDMEVRDGDVIPVGRLSIRAIHVPGHSRGATCYLVKGGDRTYLFSGDTVFLKGEILLLNCPGSSLEEYRKNIGKLANLGVDALMPGHGMFCLTHGQEHIEKCLTNFRSLLPPPNVYRS